MRHNESLEKIGVAALTILQDMREGKDIQLNIYQLCKYSGLPRCLIYQNLKNLQRITDVC